MTNLMNNAHKAHTEASRANHEETFGHKCHWHGCRNAVTKKAGMWLCQNCRQELEDQRAVVIEKSRPMGDELGLTDEGLWRDGEPCSHPGCLNHITHPCERCGRTAGRYSSNSA